MMKYLNFKNSIVLNLFFFILTTVGYALEVKEAENEFEKAWSHPSYTQIKLDDIDVNDVLAKYYQTSVPLSFTRKMLWDMETKKAWDPKTYIAYFVKDGKSWGRKTLDDGDVVFVRSSLQKQWKNLDLTTEVFEEVYVNQKDQKITFLGVKTLKDSSGKEIQVKNNQPIFHVQHSVAGEENHPINVWRIVHLTDQKDEKLIKNFEQFNNPKALPGFIEIYIEKDLGASLKRNE